MTDLIKIMHCGCTYNVNGGGGGPAITEEIFGTGCDGDCHFTFNSNTNGHVTIPAQEYNFCNLTIDENVTLHFCGKGTPILKVKECFVNNGTILLRNPLLCENYDEYIQGIGKVVHNKCNYCYDCACAYYNCEDFTLACLSGQRSCGGVTTANCLYGGYGGKAGENGGAGCGYCNTCLCKPGCSGGISSYSNAGGGGGAGGYALGQCLSFAGVVDCSTAGCSAGNGIGGDGGTGWYKQTSCGTYRYVDGADGGGGGYGYYKGGKGGDSIGEYYGLGHRGGSGGNSYLGDGGEGGSSLFINTCGCYSPACCCTRDGGSGGCSYRGNGGNGGAGCVGGSGGSSIYGNGGDVGCSSCTYYNDRIGGSSIFGRGGNGGIGGNGLDGGTAMRSSCNWARGGIAWGGVYGLGLFAKNIEHNGLIYGRGGDGGSGYNCCCAFDGTDGAEIYIVVGNNYCASGEITCRAGCGGSVYTGTAKSKGKPGFVKFCHL